MMLFKLSLKNIARSIKDYAIYFFTLILGVAIFYIFNAIESQTVMMNVSSSTYELIDLMNNMLSGVSVFVAFILGFLIIYANRFLMKRRNKEFGIYLTLGMSKRKISLILFFETLIVGVISLVVGLVLGTALSQVMSLLVANMFEAKMTEFEFVFSSAACLKTLIYFSVMYVLVMIFNTYAVSRSKLIDLLNAGKKAEKVKMKNPWICVIVFIISVCTLAYSYWCVTGGISDMQSGNTILIPIALGAISTFFIFWSLSGLLLKIFMSMKNVYYKGLNSFTLRQFSSKINTTVFSMTIICLMLFFTICILSSAISIRNSMTANLQTLVPVDIEINKKMDLPEGAEFSSAVVADSKVSVRETLNRLGFDVNKYFKDTLEFNLYVSNDFLVRDTLGSAYEEIAKQFPYLDYNMAETFIKESDYNKLAKLYKLKKQFKKNLIKSGIVLNHIIPYALASFISIGSVSAIGYNPISYEKNKRGIYALSKDTDIEFYDLSSLKEKYTRIYLPFLGCAPDANSHLKECYDFLSEFGFLGATEYNDKYENVSMFKKQCPGIYKINGQFNISPMNLLVDLVMTNPNLFSASVEDISFMKENALMGYRETVHDVEYMANEMRNLITLFLLYPNVFLSKVNDKLRDINFYYDTSYKRKLTFSSLLSYMYYELVEDYVNGYYPYQCRKCGKYFLSRVKDNPELQHFCGDCRKQKSLL